MYIAFAAFISSFILHPSSFSSGQQKSTSSRRDETLPFLDMIEQTITGKKPITITTTTTKTKYLSKPYKGIYQTDIGFPCWYDLKKSHRERERTIKNSPPAGFRFAG